VEDEFSIHLISTSVVLSGSLDHDDGMPVEDLVAPNH
jgi:hypothetical protein